MTDYERRGGGGGQNNYRKRRYRDDDNDYRSQRRRQDVPVPLRIRRQLLSLAESPVRRWSEDAVSLGRLVVENDDDGLVREGFVALVFQMALEQPLKTPFVAAVLLVVNALGGGKAADSTEAASDKKATILPEVLRKISTATEAAIAAGQWREVKLQLRLLACLQTCMGGDGVFAVLEALFARAVDLQTASSDDVIGTELVKIILLTIPYIMAAGAPSGAQWQRWQQQAGELMEKTDIIASEPHALQKLMDPYVHDSTTAMAVDEEAEPYPVPPPTESVLALLQKQLQAEAANGWPLACLPRPWQLPLSEVELQSQLDEVATDEGRRHALPAIAVPETVVAGPRPLFPEVYFSVYGAGRPLSVPPVTSVAASLIRDSLLDTINGLDFNRNVTARFLIDVDCYFAEGTFVKRATPFDRLREVEESGSGASTWKPEDVAVDAVFSQLLQLPAPEHKLVYYHAVLAEACKIAPAAIAPSLGRAIRYLYSSSAGMDLELAGRFIDWFAHHLSNFGFTWKWAEWVDDVALPDAHPHKAFIRGALDKEIRLSFAQRIKNTLPLPYQELITAEMEQDVPVFPYEEGNDNNTPFAAQGRELASLLRRKAADEEVQAVIERVHEMALDAGGDDPLVASTDVFTTAVLWVGAKSLSHVLACIERNKDRLLDAGAASEPARRQILTAVMTFWGAHPGNAVSITEKLLNYAILTPETVVHWALGDGMADTHLSEPYVAELVFHTVAKVTRRVHQLVAAARTAEAAVPAAQRALEAARERQKNPPPPPAPSAAATAANMDVDQDQDQDNGGASSATAEAAEAVAAAVAEATVQVEAAETALTQATADVEAAQTAQTAEIHAMRALFQQVAAALEPWTGHGDTLVQAWAGRWQRVVQRRQAIEEAFLAEATKGQN